MSRVLRGNHSARIDDKGRLKVPSEFRALIEEAYGPKLFVTSFDGQSVRVYPLQVWEGIEANVAQLPSTDPRRRKFLQVVNYYGQSGELDAQGRVLIPTRLRESADVTGEVDVLGLINLLEVWNHERFATKIEHDPLSDADTGALSSSGI